MNLLMLQIMVNEESSKVDLYQLKVLKQVIPQTETRCLARIQPDTRDIQMSLVGQRRPALPRTNSAVPSALGGLTSGFGMGPGVPPLPKSLTNEGHSIINQST